jgi:3-polyprenyl-4-hydroxybenzoate decarboxylase
MGYPYKSFREWISEEEALGNVVRVKAPIKCGDYDNVVDIGNGVPGKQPESELRAVTRYLHSLPGKPIGIIEKPIDNRPDIPVITNLWPTRERTSRGLGCSDKAEFIKKFEIARRTRIKASIVSKSKAPCKEIIIPDEKVDLMKDIPRCWVEFNQVLWSTCNGTIVVYDPDKGTHDLGKLRMCQYEWKDADPNTPYPEEMRKKYAAITLIYHGAQQSNAGKYYYDNYRTKNRAMPAAFIFGIPTDVHVIAAFRNSYKWPETGDEYEAIGGLRGEPVEVVESETIPGLMVPAHAEWVIEGEVLPEEEIMPTYAEDIASGHMFGGESCPRVRVKCITHRKNPLWTATTFSSSGLHGHLGVHTGLILLNSEVDAISFMRDIGLKVKDVVITDAGRAIAIVQLEVDGLEKVIPYYGKVVAQALRGCHVVGAPFKYIIVVGPDIDPYDLNDVLWALGTRSMPVSDSIMIEKGLVPWGDPGGLPDHLGWKCYGEQMMIDALIKVPERYATWPPRCEPAEWEKEAIERIKRRLR